MRVTVNGLDGPNGLNGLAADIDHAAEVAPAAARQVVRRGALNVKNSWRRRWSGLSHAPAVGAAVTFDTEETATGTTAEIGPDKDRRQGALGNLLEYGSLNNAPIPGGLPALQEEQPRFERALEALVERTLDNR